VPGRSGNAGVGPIFAFAIMENLLIKKVEDLK
jgi:hypothetical protein